ncbi:MAG: 30S ribosomal protein S3ae [Nitrososphaeria archaeon]|nr:30S ribosomal protein S3ae [Nitrososphaeria archaeon]
MPKKGIKVKDKWREKIWISVEAPAIFGNKVIAKIPVTNIENAIGRCVETTLFDILGESEEQYAVKLKFQIKEIMGETAKTEVKQYELARETLKSLIRKGTSIVDFYKNLETKDKAKIRIFAIVYTSSRINTSKKKSIRKIMDEIISKKVERLTFDQFVLESVLGKIGSEILTEAKKITKIRYANVRKIKVLSYPLKETLTPSLS